MIVYNREHFMPGDVVFARRMGTALKRQAVIKAAYFARKPHSDEMCVVYDALLVPEINFAGSHTPICFASCHHEITLSSRSLVAHRVYNGTSEALPIRLGYRVKVNARDFLSDYVVVEIKLSIYRSTQSFSPTEIMGGYGVDIGIVDFGGSSGGAWQAKNLATLPSFYTASQRSNVLQVLPPYVGCLALLDDGTPFTPKIDALDAPLTCRALSPIWK